MKKIYFASDFHLGTPSYEKSRVREAAIVSWLDSIKHDAEAIYLVGDLFDFWFDYKEVIPRGFVRFIGKLAEITDSGIPVYFFTGNHDMWMFDYFEKELGVTIYRKPIIREFGGKRFYIGHGDGLGPGDYTYKILQAFFASKVCQWLFARIHPNLGIGIANRWSRSSRAASGAKEAFLGENDEWLVQYCHKVLQTEKIDYFIFGHRHLVLDIQLNEESRYINLGDWLKEYQYGVFDGQLLELKRFEV